MAAQDSPDGELLTVNTLITGGAGFIGSGVVRHLLSYSTDVAINVDKLTCAGNLDSLLGADSNPRYTLVHADIVDSAALDA